MARSARAARLAGAVYLCLCVSPVLADERGAPPLPMPERPAWPASPWHGRVDGDGRVIPCRCRAGGRQFMLGEHVCMPTPDGPRLARCDLFENNTTWVPTGTACELS